MANSATYFLEDDEEMDVFINRVVDAAIRELGLDDEPEAEPPSNRATETPGDRLAWSDALSEIWRAAIEKADKAHLTETFHPTHGEEQVFRPQYRELNGYQKAAIADIKSQATQLLSLVNAASQDSRCACLARTRLEEAVMWAVKAVS